MFKFIAQIQNEFMKFARRWEDLPYEYQVGYVRRHPDTRRKVTAPPTPTSPTSGLKIHTPSRGHAHPILDLLRSTTNASTDKPIERKYLTMREGTANKFHYFVVFPTKDGQFAAANAYGRIGYEPKAIMFAKGPSERAIINEMNEKFEKKLKKGYQQSKMSEEDSTPVSSHSVPASGLNIYERADMLDRQRTPTNSEQLLKDVLKENKRLRKMLESRRESM